MAASLVGTGSSLNGAKLIVTDTYSSMDPRLQRIVAYRRRGIQTLATASSEPDETVVIAKVTDLNQWEQLSEVRVGTTIGATPSAETWLVTGRVPVERVESVRRQPFVRSLEGAQFLQPALTGTAGETGARPDLLPFGNQTDGGEGTVVGIIDYGMDFAHQNFRNPGGGTRLLSIWHQEGFSHAGNPFGYGREYTQDQINHALEQTDPYGSLGYQPDSIRGTHGTHVADIAAGNGRGSSAPGIAPRANLVFVDVARAYVPIGASNVVASSFGDSVRLVEALQYVFAKAGNRPCVINVSLGTHGGPHDGSTLVEQAMDVLVRDTPNRALVIAAGNFFDAGIHASGTVKENAHLDLVWEVTHGDWSHNELEIWYRGQDRLGLELIAPGGHSLGKIEPGSNGELVQANKVLIFVSNRLDDPNNNDNTIGIFLDPDVPAGQWIVRLHGMVVQDGSFHAWIERDNLFPSRFGPPYDNTHTIGSISCGHETIVVGSYDAHKDSLPLSYFSSAGPTRDNREKPEISAPGHHVLAAHSRTGTGVVRKSGTSMAAPTVTGVVALMLAQAHTQGSSLDVQQIRLILANTARRNPPDTDGWHNRFGSGRVSASRAVKAVMALK